MSRQRPKRQLPAAKREEPLLQVRKRERRGKGGGKKDREGVRKKGGREREGGGMVKKGGGRVRRGGERAGATWAVAQGGIKQGMAWTPYYFDKMTGQFFHFLTITCAFFYHPFSVSGLVSVSEQAAWCVWGCS